MKLTGFLNLADLIARKKSEKVLTMIGLLLILSRLQLNNAGLKIMLLGLPTVYWFDIPMPVQQLSGTGVT